MEKTKKYTHISWNDRIAIEKMLTEARKAGRRISLAAIARRIGKTRQAVSLELKRSPKYERLDGETWKIIESYSPELAQTRYEAFLEVKGGSLKIGNDMRLAGFLQEKILQDKCSPAVALAKAREEESKKPGTFSHLINSKTTVYKYIERGYLANIELGDLPYRKKQKKRKLIRRSARPPKGPSIEKRPEYINDRSEAGHWEMDTVHGDRFQGDTLLVLTERVNRLEIITKLPDCKSDSVVAALDAYESILGTERFRKVFKSITVDNGSEFADYIRMKKSRYTPDSEATSEITPSDRTAFYYCHAFHSWERGLNENANKLIRRHIPKGTRIERYSVEAIAVIQQWINLYPRLMFDWKCPA